MKPLNDEMMAKEIGLRIAANRKYSNLTQVQLAELANVSQNSLSLYESGQRDIRLQELNRISEVLKVPLSLFLFGEETNDVRIWREKYEDIQRKYSFLYTKLEELLKRVNGQK